MIDTWQMLPSLISYSADPLTGAPFSPDRCPLSPDRCPSPSSAVYCSLCLSITCYTFNLLVNPAGYVYDERYLCFAAVSIKSAVPVLSFDVSVCSN